MTDGLSDGAAHGVEHLGPTRDRPRGDLDGNGDLESVEETGELSSLVRSPAELRTLPVHVPPVRGGRLPTDPRHHPGWRSVRSFCPPWSTVRLGRS